MYEMLKEFIKPEMLVLIPVLYIIGIGLKKSLIADKHIPWALGVISVCLCTMFIAATSNINGWQGAIMVIFSGMTQGVLCAGASVYVNQIVKQSIKDE
jgi:hypothetical protein